MKRFALIIALCLLLTAACSPKTANIPIAGLADIAQDAGMYHGLAPDTPLLSAETQAAAYQGFLKEHFSPWDRTTPKHSADDAFWGFDVFGPKKLYGENTLLRPSAWIEQMREYSRIPQYPSMSRKAIAVTNTSMRVFPTSQPAFQDFTKAGEGYPFDYMQNSLVLTGTPLYATHMSADRAWILVESRFAFGWVPATDIGWVDNGFISLFKTGTYAALTRDDVPITNTYGGYHFSAHIGTILPIMEGGFNDTGMALLFPVRTKRGYAEPMVTFLPNAFASPAPLQATPANFTRLIDSMLGRPYGWGGLYEDRDCSSALMDLMASFGIYLPRNSSQQIKIGTLATLDGMSRMKKKQFMTQIATPFLTLVRKPGHIMLYIGHQDGEPIVFHSVWGLKTEKNGTYGRRVIGGAVISTLAPGQNLPNLANPGGIWLDSVKAISVLPGTQNQ